MINPQATQESERIHYIDWLRIIAVLLLIIFHSARIFDIFDPFYVKNAIKSSFLSYSIILFLNQWQVPLLFLLAGASTWFALNIRSGKQYLSERLKRLLIPFIFGILAIVPPQAYLARLQNSSSVSNFLTFLPDYFRIRGDLTGYTGLFTPGHLWFILFLFVFALIFLPAFLFWKTEEGTKWINNLAKLSEKPAGIYVFLLPLLIAGALPDFGGKNPFFYGTIFVSGFILMADRRFQKIINRSCPSAFILGVITMAGLILFDAMHIPTPKYSLADIISYVLRTINTWFFMIAILGYGQMYLNKVNPFLRYANKATYPFYILHQTVIVTIGFFVVRWEANVALKFIVIALISLLATILLYEVGVRRTNVTRFLFGMKIENRPRIKNSSEQPVTN